MLELLSPILLFVIILLGFNTMVGGRPSEVLNPIIRLFTDAVKGILTLSVSFLCAAIGLLIQLPGLLMTFSDSDEKLSSPKRPYNKSDLS